MRTLTKSILPVAALAMAAGPFALATGAHAADGGTTFSANLTELNDSGVSSTAMATLDGTKLHVTLKSSGKLAGAPHAQHIHIGAQNTCPDTNATGSGPDGHLQTLDAADSYGAVKVSLTKSGDTSADSALAVDRFPVGDAVYERTITLPKAVADDVRAGKGVVVQHGVDYNGNGKYDGEAKSDLDPSLPAEATDPAACGVLKVSQMNQMPTGGVQTGEGSSTGLENGAALTGGLLAVAAGAGGLLVLRRRHANDDA